MEPSRGGASHRNGVLHTLAGANIPSGPKTLAMPPTAPRALRERMANMTIGATPACPPPPRETPPPLPPSRSLADQAVQCGASAGEQRAGGDAWPEYVQLLSRAISAYARHADLAKEREAHRKTVAWPQFTNLSLAARETLLLRAQQLRAQSDAAASELNDALLRLQTVLPLHTAAGGGAAPVAGPSRHGGALQSLRAQLDELQASMHELQSYAGVAPTSSTITAEPSSRAAPGAESDPPPPGANWEQHLQELSDRLADVEGQLYQEADDYREAVDDYVAARLRATGSVHPRIDALERGMAALGAGVRELEAGAVATEQRKQEVEAENAGLRRENERLQAEVAVLTNQLQTVQEGQRREMQSIYREIELLQKSLTDFQNAPLPIPPPPMPSRDEVVAAVFPILRDSLREDVQVALETTMSGVQNAIQQNQHQVLSTVMPKVNLTNQSANRIFQWLEQMAKSDQQT